MLPTSIRHAWRSLLRTPVFTIAAAFTLVIGVGASVAIFAVLNGVLLKPLPYGNAERLVGVWNALPPVNLRKIGQTSGLYFPFKTFARSVENIGLYQEGSVSVAERGGASEPLH